MKTEGGYTLIELIMVLFLITLVTGLSSFFFVGSSSSSKLNATAREISAIIRHAGYLSRIKGEYKPVLIDLDSRRYGIEGHGYKAIPPGIGVKVIDPVSGKIGSGIYRPAFRAGSMQSGTIILWNKTREVRIESDPVVGSVTVK